MRCVWSLLGAWDWRLWTNDDLFYYTETGKVLTRRQGEKLGQHAKGKAIFLPTLHDLIEALMSRTDSIGIIPQSNGSVIVAIAPTEELFNAPTLIEAVAECLIKCLEREKP